MAAAAFREKQYRSQRSLRTGFLRLMLCAGVAGTVASAAAPHDALAGFEWIPPAQLTPMPEPMQDERPDYGMQSDMNRSTMPAQPPAGVTQERSGASAPMIGADGYPVNPQVPFGGEVSMERIGAPGADMTQQSSYPPVQGFGRDIPLALALRQIVPDDYAFSFDRDVDVATSVTWTGGDAWDEVLRNALSEHDLGVKILPNKTVRIGKKSTLAQTQVTQNDGARVMGMQTTNGQVRRIESHAAVPLETPEAPPQRAPGFMNEEQSSGVANPIPMLMKNAGQDTGEPIDLMSGQQNAAAPAGTYAHAPASPMSAGAAGQTAAPTYSHDELEQMYTAAAHDGGNDDMVATPINVPQVVVPVSADDGQGKGDLPDVSDDLPSVDDIVRQHSYISVPEAIPNATVYASSPGETLDPFALESWSAREGENLRDVLARWSDKAGVTLYWGVTEDYVLPRAYDTNGTFEMAVREVLSVYNADQAGDDDFWQKKKPKKKVRTDRYEDTDRPIGKLHPNLPLGPSVLIIEDHKKAL